MKVLVTGATSLLGRSIVDRLVARGEDVSVLQRSTSGLAVNEYLGDIADSDAVTKAVEGTEAVIHVAGLASVTGDWARFEATNVAGTRNAVTAALRAGATRFVYISSPSVAHAGSPLVGVSAGTADPSSTRGHYATSKAMGELIALAADSPHMSVVALRPHLIWGPRDTQLVGRIVDRAIKGRLAIIGSGAALIDTTYIDNAADAVVAGLDRAPTLGGRSFVVTNGQPRPVRELVDRIVMAAGMELPTMKVPYLAARAGGAVVEQVWDRRATEDEPPITGFLAEQLGTAHWFDQRETRQALGWTPAVSLAEGFERLHSWFNESDRGLLGE
jgi:nucleoside-diphosphate-sugar epimerase